MCSGIAVREATRLSALADTLPQLPSFFAHILAVFKSAPSRVSRDHVNDLSHRMHSATFQSLLKASRIGSPLFKWFLASDMFV